jgi:acetyl/propionyl-CoA carboxylase alpha subunit
MERVVTSLDVRVGAETVAVQIDADGQVRVGDLRFTVEPIGAGLYRVFDGSQHWTIAVAGTGEDCWIFADGQVHQIEVSRAGSGHRRKSAATGQELSAPMPATVVMILVEPGAKVARGDALITLEAMKMELSIRAPRDAVVTAIHCKAGDLVPPGINLLDLS